MRLLWTAILIAIIPAAAASGATYYVDTANPQAADANAGTEAAPFKTISQAAKTVAPGDTVLIKGGVYRETVWMAKSGAQDKPITFKAAEGQRVIVTGADPITGWKRCTREDVAGNENFEKIFMVDLDWMPARLIESCRKTVDLTLARLPAEGWWQPTAAEGRKAFSDTAHLTQKDPKAWDGWTIAAMYSAGGGVTRHTDFTFDPEAHKITLAKDWSEYADIDPKRDTYYMENHPLAIAGPGQYVFRKSGQGARLFVWPTRVEGDQPVVEGVRRTEVLTPQNAAYLVIDGLELCYAGGQGVGHNVKLSDSIITNCYIHDCSGYGIGLYPGERVAIRRNIIRQCGMGIVFLGGKDNLVQETDIGWSLGDGLDAAGGVRNLHIERNIIHDNYRYGHPDNIQFWDDIDGLVIQDNVLLNGGQSMMSSNLRNTRIVNNLVLGSHAVALIVGGESGGPVYNLSGLTPQERTKRIQAFETGETDHIEVLHNTISASALQPTGFWGSGYTVTDNVIAPLHESPMYMVSSLRSMKADYNLLDRLAGSTKFLIMVEEIKKTQEGGQEVLDMKTDYGTATLEMLREKWGLEKHGIVGDPKFVSAPKFYIVSHYAYVAASTRTKLITWGKVVGQIAVGDHVEIAFDGVPRRVTEVGDYEGQGYIVFEPPLAAAPEFSVAIADWGDKTDCTWNLALAEDSPGHKAASDGTDIGCTINLQNYLKCDFNGDGKRDLPELPKD